MTPQILLIASSSIFILLLHFFQPSLANCTPACGVIRNISYPFRLKHDDKHCGDRKFELACENDVASLSLNSRKYYVKEINYLNSTIRLVDASLNNDICSFPSSSLHLYNFTNSLYGGDQLYFYRTKSLYSPFEDVAWPLSLMSCPHPLKNSSLFTEITHCQTSNSSHSRFTYVKVGHMNVSEVPAACTIEVIVMTSWEFKNLKNISLAEIHDALLYGFQLSLCMDCQYYAAFGRFFPLLVVIIDVAWPLSLMSCPHPMKNSSLFTEITHCQTSNSSHSRFTYVKVGDMKVLEVPATCTIDVIVMTSWEFKDLKNVSLAEIHNSLLYGFQLALCMDCMTFTELGNNARYGLWLCRGCDQLMMRSQLYVIK